MKCLHCGKEISDDSQFCSCCGKSVVFSDVIENNEENCVVDDNEDTEEQSEKTSNNSYEVYNYSEQKWDKKARVINEHKIHKTNQGKKQNEEASGKIKQYWENQNFWGKAILIAIIVSCFMLILSLLLGKYNATKLSIMQIIGFVIVFLMHVGKIRCEKRWIKRIVLFYVLFIVIANCSWYSLPVGIIPEFNLSNSTVMVDTPYSSDECLNQNYKKIANDFRAAGFVNVEEQGIADLNIEDIDMSGEVSKVSINGESAFEGNEEYKSTAFVIIEYHSLKNVKTPISSDDAIDMNVEELLKKLEEAGFMEITTEEVYDLDPDTTTVDFENRISINGNSVFDKNDEYPLDAKVKIVTHRPYEKYTLKIDIDFVGNWIFNTYNVLMEIGKYSEVLEHGEDGEFEYRLTPGEYTIKFSNEETNSIDGTIKINLTGDTAVSYRIMCYSDEVSIETLYLENKSAVGEDEAMVPTSASDFKYENYKSVEEELKKVGFTNITTNILYDIIWGITDEGDVESVSIDGKYDFIRGDIFKKDAEIVITYHMDVDDDPNKKVETSESDDEQAKNELDDKDETSKSVFYSTNNYEDATKGNKGIFSYRSKGGSYDVYWIVDFDAGYVYTFTEGNGTDYCDKTKMDSGTLNDQVKITWDYDGDQATWYLHFKYVEHPETLVVNDHLGITTEFTTVDLYKALALRNQKTIVNM